MSSEQRSERLSIVSNFSSSRGFVQPNHSISSFARTSSRSGILRPSCFAVFRLLKSSKTSGCVTIISAGLAPFRIPATHSAGAPEHFGRVRTIGKQAACLYVSTFLGDGREAIFLSRARKFCLRAGQREDLR